MDIHFTPEEQAFRDEVRSFLTSELPADIASRVRLGRRLPSRRSSFMAALV